MDPLTKEIIALLRRDGRASYSDIARKLDITRDSVRKRISPLLRSGALRVITAPNPRLWGLNVSAHLSIRVTCDPREVIISLEDIRSLAFISIAVGAFHIISETEVRSISDLNHQVSTIRSLNGVEDVKILIYDHVIHSFFLRNVSNHPCYDLDDYDLKLIYNLQTDGRASYGTLAKHVELSISSCRARMQRMLEAGVIQIGAIQARSEMTDLLFGIGLVVKDNAEEASKLLGSIPGLEFLAKTVGRFDLIATLSVDSLRDFNSLTSQLLQLPSVYRCEQWMHSEVVRERYEHAFEFLLPPSEC